MSPLEHLIVRINRNGDINAAETPRPLITLEEFFEGNDDYGSIGYNFYPDQPAPVEFYNLFRRIRSRPDVADVRIQVSQHEVADEWPSCDTVWFITRASPAEVLGWLGERFRPDEVLDGWSAMWMTVEPYVVPPGLRPIGVWWD